MMQFARRLFLVAGVYGILALLPQYFLEARIGRDDPPAITHPEYFYGFIGVGLAWQVLFLIISRDPSRYRLAMIPGLLEKLGFGGVAVILLLQHRIAPVTAGFGCVDLVLALLFLIAFRRTAPVAGGRVSMVG
jgi:hypothetical protein